MIEVEVKLPVTDLDEIKSALKEFGFKEKCLIEEHDTYFDNQQGDIRTNDEALRVRETKDHLSGKVWAQINFKGKKLDTRTMTREELETGVEDGAVCRNILQAIGYIPVAPEVIKKRLMLQKESITVCLDNVHGLGEFLELEILADSEEKKDDWSYVKKKYKLNYAGSVKNFVALVKNGSFLVRITDMTILIEKEFIYGSSKRPNPTDYYRKQHYQCGGCLLPSQRQLQRYIAGASGSRDGCNSGL